MQNQFPGNKIAYFRCDNAKEYVGSSKLESFCTENGIVLDPVPPYSPELNGVAERMNRTIMERMRAMIFDSNLAFKMWPFALKTTVYVINRSPSKVNDFKIPYERFFGTKPDLKNVKVFGALANRHILKEVRQNNSARYKNIQNRDFDPKLLERYERSIFLEHTNTGYLLLDPSKNK